MTVKVLGLSAYDLGVDSCWLRQEIVICQCSWGFNLWPTLTDIAIGFIAYFVTLTQITKPSLNYQVSANFQTTEEYSQVLALMPSARVTIAIADRVNSCRLPSSNNLFHLSNYSVSLKG